uniref:ShKT domain-containing protein n=1 Tax=Emiliania huxleyi TaxID=2903 RepID=A0A7S3SKK2_EMIHU
MGVISRSGWALLDDSLSARFDGAAAQWDWVAAREPERLEAERAARAADGDPRCEQWARGGECEANRAFMQGACRAACGRAEARAAAVASEASGEALLRLDWYLFAAGLDYASALRDFAALSGPQPIPPRYAFGVWFSRWWPWADWEAAGLLREFEARGVPADVLVTDMDWHHTCYRRTYGNESEKSMDASHNWPCWSGFSFDKKYFPDPPAFLGWCKAAGVHNGLNLHFQSGLVKAEEDADRWEAFRAAMGLPPDAEYAAFDPLNRTYSSHFHTHVLAPLERLGVDFWWLDWQQGEHFFGGSETPEANPTFWLNYVYSTQPDGRATPASAQRRRLIMHRWGGLGNQRYPIGFSGDTKSTWESLAFQPGFTASAANVAFGYWSHDIGGFFDRVEPELYVRWVQLGSLSPVFRAHGFRDPLHERRFWLFDEAAFVAMRSALRLRAELVPHLYTAARAAYDGGPSPVRPLYHEWPGLQPAYDFGGEYLFGAGQSLAVAHLTRRSSSGLSWSPLGAVL